jgi:hypothetical protein
MSANRRVRTHGVLGLSLVSLPRAACIAACAAAPLVALAALHAQPPAAPSPLSLAPVPSRTIDACGFLAGTWQGEMNGAFVEEIWSTPRGNNIVGTFRWLRADGTPAMLEMLAITQEASGLRLRLRHYSALLHAKEETDKPITLKLTENSPSHAVFAAEQDAGSLEQIVYRVENDTLHITVEFASPQDESGPRPPLKFELRKQ